MKHRLIVCSAVVLAMIALAPRECPAQSAEIPSLTKSTTPAPKEPSAATKQKVGEEYGKLPLSFETNQGQTDPKVKFLSHGPGYSLFLLPHEAVLLLQRQRDPKTGREFDSLRDFSRRPKEGASPPSVIRMNLLGSDPGADVSGLERMQGAINYFIGNDPKQWRINVPHYARVRYKGAYPGIDVIYHGNQRQLEYDFVVAPGADPQKIALGIKGAKKLELSADGDLLLHTSAETVRLRKPIIYQESGGRRREVDGGFMLASTGIVKFRIGKYNPSRPLVIDPVLSYSTFLGGTADENVIGGLIEGGLAVDANGDAYVLGFTNSIDFPVTAGAFQAKCGTDGACNGGQTKVFVAKLNSAGNALLYSTYLGGSGTDSPGTIGLAGITVDALGNAFLTGATNSIDFPTTAGAFKTTCTSCSNGFGDAFVTELNPTGSGLVFSTYLGGSKYNEGEDVKEDSSGVYVTGLTFSTDFPTTPGVLQPAIGGTGGNVFVTKLNPTGSALLYSTYLGGRDGESPARIAVDSSRSAFVIGSTNSSNFPTTASSVQPVATSGGVFKTINGGTNWTASNSGLTDLAVQALAIDQLSTQTIYAGTFGLGIFKSTDGGSSWAAMNSGLTTLNVLTLATDPNTTGAVAVLYAGTAGGGVFKSTDGGTSWAPMNIGLTAINIRALAIDASTGGSTQVVYAGGGGGVFKSTNGGASWTVMNGTPGAPLGNRNVQTLILDPTTSGQTQIVYAGTAGGVFKSADGGNNWMIMNAGLTTTFIRTLAIDPASPLTLYAGTLGGGVFKTTNGGVHWAVMNNGLPAVNIQTLAIVPNTSGASQIVYAGGGGGGRGVFKSTDGANTWVAVNSGLATLVRALAIDPNTTSNVYAGTVLLDAFVTKLDSGGASLVYSTFLGGLGNDFASGLALDSSGSAYVVGSTTSPDFRTTSGVPQPSSAGGSDAFVAKLNPAGSSLLYSTYLGGSGSDFGYDIAVDGSGDAWVVGSTNSLDFPTILPLRAALDSDGCNGGLCLDAFIAELNPAGSGLLFSTYLGGRKNDEALGIALDNAGVAPYGVYVAGYTESPDFPSVNAAQPTFGGGNADAFVLKISNTSISADLAIAASASPNPVLAGGLLAFNITITNNGPATATGVTFYTTGLAQQSAVDLTTVSATPSQGTCDLHPICNFGTLASGASATLTVVTTPKNPGTFVGAAAVGGNESDPNTANNTATVNVTVNPAIDLQLHGTDSPSPVLVNTNLTYTLMVQNNGQIPATGVTLTDTLPAGVTLFQPATSTQGTCTGTTTISCAVGGLAVNAQATVTIVVTPTVAGTITNNSTVAANESSPNPAHNVLQQLTDVIAVSNANNAQLNGTYAFLFNGFDASGMMAMAGSFVADGAGNISGGIADINRVSGVTLVTNPPFTGTYSIGLDGRGAVTLNFGPALGSATFRVALGLLNAQGVATKARVIEFDTTGTSGSGVIEKQDTTAFSTAKIAGDFAFGGFGDAPGNVNVPRSGLAGRVHLDGAGNVTLGIEDVNAGGVYTPNLAFTGTYTVPAPSTTGRGTDSLTFATSTVHDALYVVSANEVFFVNIDAPRAANPLISGQALKQMGTFSNASLSGASVLDATGLASLGNSDVTIGLLTADGAGNATVVDDENSGGNVGTQTQNGTYSVAANGRTTFTPSGGGNVQVYYLADLNKGFAVFTGGKAGSGSLEPQVGGPFSNASIFGNYFFGDIGAPDSGGSNSTGVVMADGAGNLFVTEDQSNSGSLSTDSRQAATYTVSANGRASLTAGNGDSTILYVISPSKAVAIDASSSNTNSKITVIEGSTAAVADLALTKTAFFSQVFLGSQVTFALTVTNNGPNLATGAVLTDTLPAGLTFVSASPSQGVCSGTTTVICSLGAIANGKVASVDIVATAAAVGAANNTATVAANEADPNLANNTASANVTILSAADVTLNNTAAPSQVLLGANLTYTITASDVGNLPATGVTVTDTLPAGVAFVSATPSQGTPCTGTATITCVLGGLANSASATVTIVVTPSATGAISDTASVALNEADPTLGDNTATAIATVLPATAVERYLITEFNSALVHSFNAADNSPAGTARAGAAPSSVAVSPNGRLAFVSNGNATFVSAMDLTLNAESARIRGLLGSSNAALNADGTRLAVPLRNGAPAVAIVDTSNYQILKTVPISGASFLGGAIVVNNVAYVSASTITPGGPTVFAVDMNSFAVTAISGMGSAQAAVFLGKSLAATPDGSSVLAVGQSNKLLIIDTIAKAVVRTVDLGFFPESIAITQNAADPNGVFAYIGTFGSLHVLDLRAGSPTFEQLIPNAVATLTSDAKDIAVTADGKHAIVISSTVDANNNDVFVVDTAVLRAGNAGAIMAQFNVGGVSAVPTGVAVSFVQTGPDANAPVVATVNPGAVVNDASQVVHVTGSNFAVGALVRIGSMDPIAAANVTSGALDVTIPLAAPARSAADIVVTNPNTALPVFQQHESGILRAALRISNSANYQPVNQFAATEFGDGALAILDTANRFASTTPVGSFPLSLAITPDGTRAYLQTFNTGLPLAEVNLGTGLLEKTIALPNDTASASGFGGALVAVPNPAGGAPAQLVYVLTSFFPTPGNTDLRLVVIDADPASPTFNTVLTAKSINANLAPGTFFSPLGLGATPDGHFAYASDSSGDLVIFDVLKGTATVVTIAALGVPSFQQTISISPDGKSLLLAGGSGSPAVATGSIEVFDIGANPLSPALVGTITGTPPTGLNQLLLFSYKVAGNRLFAFDPSQHVVAVFNFVRGTPNNFSQLGSFVVPGNAFFFTSFDVTPDGSLIYVPVDEDDAVAAISTANIIAGTPALVTNIGVGLSPAFVAVSPVVAKSADLALTKSASPNPVLQGANLTYTLSVTNNGPSSATGVTVTDTLPAGVTFVNATPSQGAPCTGTTTVTCVLGTVANGANSTISLVVNVNATTTGSITNTASVTANETDPNPANNSASQVTTVTSGGGCTGSTIQWTGSAGDGNWTTPANWSTSTLPISTDNVCVGTNFANTPIAIGSLAAANQTIASLISNATISFMSGPLTIAGSATFVNALSVSGGTLTLNGGSSLQAALNMTGGTLTGTGTLAVTGLFTWSGGTLSGAGVTNANGGMSFPSGQEVLDTRTLNVTGATSFASTNGDNLVLQNGAVINNAGGSTWTLAGGNGNGLFLGTGAGTFNNAGTFQMTGGTANGVGVTFNNTGTVSVNSGTLSFGGAYTQTAGATLLNGGSISSTGTLNINGGKLGGTGTVGGNVSINSGGILSPGFSPGTINIAGNYAQTSTGSYLAEIAGLTAGTQYDQVDLTGPGTATLGGMLNVTLLSGFVPAAGNSFTILSCAATPTCLTGTFASTNLPALPVGLAWNIAYNSTSVVLSVNATTGADIMVTKTASAPTVHLGGGPFTYTAIVTNNGPSQATAVTLTDPLPSLVSVSGVTTSQGTCTGTTTISCALGTLANGASATVAISANPVATGSATNTASVSANEVDPNPNNNSSSVTTQIVGAADLALAKTGQPNPVNAGSNLTYTLTASNNGPSAATGVTLTDPLPAGVTFVSATASQGTCRGTATVICAVGTIANAGSASVTIVVTPTAAGTLTNTATVTLNEFDPNTANNSASVNTVVNAAADLALAKTGAPNPVLLNGSLTYTLTVTNNGPSPATGVSLTDPLPAGVTFVSAAPGQGTCTGTSTISCNVGSLANGAKATVAISVKATALGTITNTASVTANEADPVPGNNTASVNTTVSPVVDMALSKTASSSTVNVGTSLTYTLTAVDNGPSPATGVTLTDTLPAGLTFVSATPSQGTCTGTTAISCNLGSLTNGANATVTIVVNVTAAAPATVTNTATVAANESDPVPGNNTASVSTTVNPVADLALTKTGTPNPAGVGVNLTYTLTASNNGPSAATGVTLTDPLPAGVTFVSATASQGTCSGTATVTCNLGTMATGVNAAVSIVVTPTAVGTITNTASVNSSVSDPSLSDNTATSTVTVVNSPTLTLSSTSLNFASQPVGSSSSAQIVTLTNGSAALPLNFVGIVASGDFSQTNNCGSSLASLASCNILVTFTPSAAGTRTGAVAIADNAVGSPQGVSLTGIGINSPAITLSPVSLIFSSRLVGTSSPPLTISMSNTGNATLNISSIAITGTNSGDFTQSNNCGATLASTASCTITVVFTPVAGGQRTAGVAITSDARGSVPVVTLSGTGLSPGIDLSTGLLIFDNETVGTTSSPQTVTLSNAGATPVILSSITATGDFAQTNTCSNSIAASTNCAIHVTFTPTATGTRTGSLTIISADPGSPHMVALTGTGVVVTLSLSPTTLTFHDQTVGTSSQAQTVKLSNTGGAVLTISSIVPSGDFLETNNCGASLAAGAACTISVSFLPTATGTRNGALTVNSNAQGSPQTVTLTGNGVSTGPAVSLSCMGAAGVITPCTSLSFPAQAVGTMSPAQKVTLTNTGNALLNISSIIPSGDFAAQSDCGQTLAANAFCTISVTFTPATTGTRAGGVTLTDNTGDSPQLIGLLGVGIPSGPAASPSTTSVAFPDQVVGTTSAAQVVTLANTGNAALTINSIKPSGDFQETSTCGNGLAPTGSCSISITFSPTTSGARAGAVTISDNAAGNPQAITLSGNGTDFSFSLPPGSPSSGTIAAGQTLTFTSVIAPLGGFNGTVTVSCSGAPTAGTCSSTPSTFTLNASTTITTKVTTTAPSSASAMGPLYTPPNSVPLSALWQLVGVLVSVLVFLVAVTRRRRAWAAAAACLCLALFISSCAGGSPSPGTVGPTPGTPPGNYTIVVSVSTASGATHSLSLTVTVHP